MKARGEKEEKLEEEKKEEVVAKKQDEEKKVKDDKKVSGDLSAEDKEQEEKLVPRAEKQAADIGKAKASGDAVDNVPADVRSIVGEEKARKLEEPVDPPVKAASAAKQGGDFIPPELQGAGQLAQSSEPGTFPSVDGMLVENIRTPELDA